MRHNAYLAEALRRPDQSQQRQEKEGAEEPADDHDEHHERAEVLVDDEEAKRHGDAGGERRQRGHGHGRTEGCEDFVNAIPPVVGCRQLVADVVVNSEVNGQTDGQTGDDRVEQHHLPPDQHESRHSDRDRQDDCQHGV